MVLGNDERCLFLFLEAHRPPAQRLLRGVMRYLEQYGLDWRLEAIHRHEAWRSEAVLQQHGGPVFLAGVNLTNRFWMDFVRAHRHRVIGLADCHPQPTEYKTVTVTPDLQSIAEQAIEHLTTAGYRCLATWAGKRNSVAQDRFQAIASVAQQRGINVHPLHVQRGIPVTVAEQQVLDHLAQLPRPIAIIAHQDQPARYVRYLCQQAGWHIPDHVGILGVDDHVEMCCDQPPHLSSVRVPWQMIGFTMARQAHRTLSQRTPSTPTAHQTIRLPCYGVTARASTSLTIASTDTLAQDALRLIRRRFHKPFSIDALSERLGVSRSTFHRRFRAAFGRSPQETLHDLRVAKACRLLQFSDQPLLAIAKACGYQSPQRLRDTFRRRHGVTPTEWRDG